MKSNFYIDWLIGLSICLLYVTLLGISISISNILLCYVITIFNDIYFYTII